MNDERDDMPLLSMSELQEVVEQMAEHTILLITLEGEANGK